MTTKRKRRKTKKNTINYSGSLNRGLITLGVGVAVAALVEFVGKEVVEQGYDRLFGKKKIVEVIFVHTHSDDMTD